jgi:transmembrane sensor
VTAGDRALIYRLGKADILSRVPGEPECKLAWRLGKLIFVDRTLSDAVVDFNRYSIKQ